VSTSSPLPHPLRHVASEDSMSQQRSAYASARAAVEAEIQELRRIAGEVAACTTTERAELQERQKEAVRAKPPIMS